MNFTIKNEEIIELNESENICFPKYTSQLINWANQNEQGTRPKVVGQLSDLFPEFQNSTDTVNIQEWQNWYLEKYPNAIDDATEKIYTQVKTNRKLLN